MKRLSLLLPLLLISGCLSRQEIPSNNDANFDYDLISHLTIEWNDIFLIENSDYFTYIYSPTCGHCIDIKNKVIEYALNHNNFYFVLYTKEIPIIADKNSIIGKTNVDEIGIVGTPSLFHMKEHVLIENIVGSNAILKTLTNDI